ncbi:MAG TPA: alpha/beta hydrolase [Gemmatimonadales bacterium]
MRRHAPGDFGPASPPSANGTVALLLPGMTLNATVFPDLAVTTVAADFTRLVVGSDGWSAELARRRMAYYAGLLSEQLREDRHWGAAARRVVVGHSFGGMLALAWLLEQGHHPLGRVDGLVLVATTAGRMLGAARVRLAGTERYSLRIPAALLMPLWNHPLLTRVLGALANRDAAPGAVDFRALTSKSDIAVGLAGWRNTDWRARRSFRYAMTGFDVRARLSEITVPTIVLHGTRDSFFSISVARELADGLPHAELRIVPGAAHVLPLTHPDAVVGAVADVMTRA